MAQKIRIKDVAELAGVSAGTVDRVLHNRGSISEKSRIAVEKAIEKMNYRTNIHLSSISLKRRYRIVITIPQFHQNDYWGLLTDGINTALEKYSGLNIDYCYCPFDQFDLFSCISTFDKIIQMEADAVIICPTFREQVVRLCNELEQRNTPYVFVDSNIEEANPLAYFMADPFICGQLLARLTTSIAHKGTNIALMQALNVGDLSANATIIRKDGFLEYCKRNNKTNKIVDISYSATNEQMNDELLGKIFSKDHNISAAVVLNSRCYIIADYFKRHNITTKLIGIDMIENNISAMRDGYIEFLIGQRPKLQGYMAMRTLFEYLVFRNVVEPRNLMPLDIVIAENLDTYLALGDNNAIE